MYFFDNFVYLARGPEPKIARISIFGLGSSSSEKFPSDLPSSLSLFMNKKLQVLGGFGKPWNLFLFYFLVSNSFFLHICSFGNKYNKTFIWKALQTSVGRAEGMPRGVPGTWTSLSCLLCLHELCWCNRLIVLFLSRVVCSPVSRSWWKFLFVCWSGLRVQDGHVLAAFRIVFQI